MKMVQCRSQSLFFFLCSLFINYAFGQSVHHHQFITNSFSSSLKQHQHSFLSDRSGALDRYSAAATYDDKPQILLISRDLLYLARIGVGQPARELSFIVDTLSDFTMLQCLPCTRCYQQSDPIFDPTKSTSYKDLPCHSKLCSSLRNNTAPCASAQKCDYGGFYRGYSISFGEIATETLSFGRAKAVNNVTLGCSHNSNGSFDGATGILGLSPGIMSLPTQLQPSSFSYCFVGVNSNSSSTLELNSLLPKDSVFVPMFHNPKTQAAYYVEVTGISVGGVRLDIPASAFQVDVKDGSGGVIIDSASPLTVLPPEAYKLLRDAFVNKTKRFKPVKAGATGIQLFDTCYDLTSSINLNDPIVKAAFPVVAFQFAGGKTLSLEPKNCLMPMDPSGQHYCFAFAPSSSSSSVSSIGNILQQGTRVSFDLKNKQIGFSPNKC